MLCSDVPSITENFLEIKRKLKISGKKQRFEQENFLFAISLFLQILRNANQLRK